MSARFNQDGNYILTGCKDNLIRRWPVNPEILAKRICDYVERQMTSAEWNEYVGSQDFESTCPNQ